ncbi:MAG: class I SAM-dependent methyltransferase [Planctomycetes bacterium]|nr:class I SAM-dependent methyltransferase [Planctomycetota bacterium]
MQYHTAMAKESGCLLSYSTRSSCRVCGTARLAPAFSLGELFVSNFVDANIAGAQIKAPLDLVFCEECRLLQLLHTAPQELLYARHYWYRSGVTETMRRALRDIAVDIEERFSLQAGDVVLDIGSNDGTLLRSFTGSEIVRVGVEPANNLAEEGSRGVQVFIPDFWSYEGYWLTVGRQARAITAIGMFYDLEDPNAFIADVRAALADDGVFVAQLMCLRNMLESNDVGNICHEHLEYYSFASLEVLLARHGLEIFDVVINNVNGGSYRIFARHAGGSTAVSEDGLHRVARVREDEADLQSLVAFQAFYSRVQKNKSECVAFIENAVATGKKVWVYGASTKGNTILQYYGLDHRVIEAAADRSPEKWGKCTVGTRIPIVSEEQARQASPDYFLVLPYAFIAEFYARETQWRESGGKFLVPLPEFRVIA